MTENKWIYLWGAYVGVMIAIIVLFGLILPAIQSDPQFISQNKLQFIESEIKSIELVLTNVTWQIITERAPEGAHSRHPERWMDLENVSFFYLGKSLDNDLYGVETTWTYPDWLCLQWFDRLELNLEFKSISTSYIQLGSHSYNSTLEVEQTFEIVDYTSSVTVEEG